MTTIAEGTPCGLVKTLTTTRIQKKPTRHMPTTLANIEARMVYYHQRGAGIPNSIGPGCTPCAVKAGEDYSRRATAGPVPMSAAESCGLRPRRSSDCGADDGPLGSGSQ